MPKIDQKRIDELFARGTVTDVFPSKDALVKKLLAGEKIKRLVNILKRCRQFIRQTGIDRRESRHIGYCSIRAVNIKVIKVPL